MPQLRANFWFLERGRVKSVACFKLFRHPPPPCHRFRLSRFLFAISSRVFAVEQFRIQRWKANGKTNLMISKHLKIGRLEPEKSRNKLQRIQKMKKSRFSTSCFVFVVAARVFAVEQFRIRRWKANGKTNLMI